MRHLLRLSALTCATLLAACSGGGGNNELLETFRFEELLACTGEDGIVDAAEASATGRLTQSSAGGPVTYITNGDWRITVDSGLLTVTIPSALSASGAFAYTSENTAEALGGRSIKHWNCAARSLMLPGDAKLTLRADAEGVMTSVDIYEGDESHRIDPRSNTILHSSVDGAIAVARDAALADGETAHLMAFSLSLSTGWDQGDVGFLYFGNLYLQGTAGDGKNPRVEPLGRMYGISDIDDYYDDPRLDDT